MLFIIGMCVEEYRNHIIIVGSIFRMIAKILLLLLLFIPNKNINNNKTKLSARGY